MMGLKKWSQIDQQKDERQTNSDQRDGGSNACIKINKLKMNCGKLSGDIVLYKRGIHNFRRCSKTLKIFPKLTKNESHNLIQNL